MIRKIARLKKPIIFATGIAYPEDIERALSVCKEEGNEDVILLKCVSSYPTPVSYTHLKTGPLRLSDKIQNYNETEQTHNR